VHQSGDDQIGQNPTIRLRTVSHRVRPERKNRRTSVRIRLLLFCPCPWATPQPAEGIQDHRIDLCQFRGVLPRLGGNRHAGPTKAGRRNDPAPTQAALPEPTSGPIVTPMLAAALRRATGGRLVSLLHLPPSWDGGSWPFRPAGLPGIGRWRRYRRRSRHRGGYGARAARKGAVTDRHLRRWRLPDWRDRVVDGRALPHTATGHRREQPVVPQ
jgi:hypothetical protein